MWSASFRSSGWRPGSYSECLCLGPNARVEYSFVWRRWAGTATLGGRFIAESSMAEKQINYIQPPNNLRQKQKLAGVGPLDPHWIEAAERSILAAKFDYLDAVMEDLGRLQSAYDRALADPANRIEHAKAIYAEVQTIKGQ